ncbi:MAG TPA: DUF998 domain-containing protein [Vicinamibacterales bacterium]|jgi:hypothetical protein
MTYALLAARMAIIAAALAIVALGALHVLKPEIHPRRTMISQYALGRFGWVMALCFASFSVAGASLCIALFGRAPSAHGLVGLAFLCLAAVGGAMAASFPMDPVSTPHAQMSFTGRMHGVAFLIGVPSQVLGTLLLSIALVHQGSHAALPLFGLTAVIWLCLVMMIVIMAMVGPGKPPDPNGPERFLGFPNRMFMIAYGVWLMAAAWPLLR